MKIGPYAFGKQGENRAVLYLKKKGYKIIENNYRTKYGEIDIIAMDGNTIVFVEVKARRSTKFGKPEDSVTVKKQRKISMVALDYLKKNNKMNQRARFDVISIYDQCGNAKIEIFANAFPLAY